MTQMTPKERVKNFFNREPVDTMPCFSGMGTVTVQAIEEMGIRFAQVHSSGEYLARSAITSAEMFGFDGFVVPYDMCTVPEAMGRGVSLYEDADGILYPTVPSKWANLDEVDMPDDFSVIFQNGRMPAVDEAIGIAKAQDLQICTKDHLCPGAKGEDRDSHRSWRQDNTRYHRGYRCKDRDR